MCLYNLDYRILYVSSSVFSNKAKFDVKKKKLILSRVYTMAREYDQVLLNCHIVLSVAIRFKNLLMQQVMFLITLSNRVPIFNSELHWPMYLSPSATI